MKTRSLYLICILFFALLAVFLYREALFGGMAVQGIDGNYTTRLMLKRSLAMGTDANWNPYYWLGTGGVLPMNTKLLFLRLFPEQINLTLCFVTMVFSGLTGMFCFLRRLELPAIPAVFGAVVYGLAPHFITLTYPAHIDSLCLVGYIPWLFLLLSTATAQEVSRSRSLAAAIAAGLVWGMILNEDVQRGIYISVAAAAFVLFSLCSGGLTKERLKTAAPALLRVGLAGVIVLLVFANNFKRQMGGARVQGKQAGISENPETRAEEQWAFATGWSLHPAELLDTLAPGYHGMVSGDPEKPYWGDRPVAHSNDSIGWFALVFAIGGLAAGFRKRYILFFGAVAMVALLLAFGKYYPGKPLFWLWYQLPMMDKMRAPVKFMSVVAFAVPVLSAFGLHSLIDAAKAQNKKQLNIWMIGFGVLFALGALGWLSMLVSSDSVQEAAQSRIGHPGLAGKAASAAVRSLGLMSLFAGLGLAAVSSARFLKQPRNAVRVVGVGFMLLALVDLAMLNRFYVKRSLFSPSEFYAGTELTDFLRQNTAGYRVSMSLKVRHNEQMIPLSLTALRGMYVTHLFPYFGIEMMESTPRARMPRDYDLFFAGQLKPLPQVKSPEALVSELLKNQLEFWKNSNVKYIVTDGYLHGLSQQPIPVFEAMKKHPDLNLVFTGKGLGGRPHGVFELAKTQPRFRLVPAEEATGAPVPATISPDGGEILLEPDAAEAAALIWASRFSSGWTVFVDGVPVETKAADGISTAFEVPAGKHRVEMVYRPRTAVRKLSVYALALGALAAILLFIVSCLKPGKTP